MARKTHGQTVYLGTVNGVLATAHNLNAELDTPFDLLAVAETTPFDYMFPDLQTSSKNLLPESAQTVANLKRLGRAMSEAGDTAQQDSAIPAAYTYFGQLLDHEITLTLEAAPGSLPALNDPKFAPLGSADEVRKKIKNGRSPSLDLDCIYGLLPHGNAEFRNGDRMRLGSVSATGNRPPGKDDFNDLHRKPPANDPKIDREAIIGDARNDENLIVAQLHVSFLRVHNALIAGGYSFSEASLVLRQHFQWLIIHDFLKRIADPAIVNEILARGRPRFSAPRAGQLFMPLEFSVAAYRFGHSLVRNTYRYNRNFEQATLGELFTLTALSGNLNPIGGDGFPTLPENWIIEWEDFLDGGSNAARRIDTNLTEPLFALRDFAGQPLPDEAMLPVRNLLRGYLLRIPTGQAVAARLEVTPLTAAEIEQAAGGAQAQVLRKTGLSTHTPLWYYVLAESAQHFPDHLGPVGSTIVAEVLIDLVRNSEDSILKQANWRPMLGAAPGRFTLRDLLRIAGVLSNSSAAIGAQSTSKFRTRGAQPMLIIEKVRAKMARIQKDRLEAHDNRDKAVAAIQGGIRSKAWKIYMEQFADTPEQLMRLMGTDGTLEDSELSIRRAYLVGNAVCGSGTPTGFDQHVDSIDH